MSEMALFDYESLSANDAQSVRATAERIRLRMKRSAEDIVAIGQDLLNVKASLPHGAFLPWIETEFGMTDRTARNFMQVAHVYGKSEIVSDLEPAALYALAAPSTPQEVRDQVEALATEGEAPTAAEIKRLKAAIQEKQRIADQAKAEAERQRERAESAFEGQEARIRDARLQAEQALQNDISETRQRADKAEAALKAEKSKLDAAVREARQAEIDRAKAEHEEAAKAALQAKKEELEKVQRAYENKKGALKNITETLSEQRAAFQRLGNAEVEANKILEVVESLNEKLALDMLVVSDVKHQHADEILERVARSAQICRQFAEALESITDIKAAPQMKVVSSD